MATSRFDHPDTLDQLNRTVPLVDKVRAIHRTIQERIGDIDRVAAALYDPKADLVKTFLDSSGAGHPLVHYQARLSESYSLQEALRTGRPRVVNDRSLRGPLAGPHSADHRARLRLQLHHAVVL